ncbi:MAG: 30S ribosomal protein S17 [Deltaproteobacteria bacterium]|nr:30S ribosomal protein S17 [Deltaproteobacteria bacterium]
MRGQQKNRTGTVVSAKMDKTVVVATHRMTKHPLYGKHIKRKVRFKAHDAENKCQIGDTVMVQETRPLSKEKCWKVVEILEKAI